jgi:hypothetical protein
MIENGDDDERARAESIHQDRSSPPARTPTSVFPDAGSRGSAPVARCWVRGRVRRFERGGALSWPCLSVVFAGQLVSLTLDGTLEGMIEGLTPRGK